MSGILGHGLGVECPAGKDGRTKAKPEPLLTAFKKLQVMAKPVDQMESRVAWIHSVGYCIKVYLLE